jgi:hypothetical protein
VQERKHRAELEKLRQEHEAELAEETERLQVCKVMTLHAALRSKEGPIAFPRRRKGTTVLFFKRQ